jgi:N-acetyl sugar amidotransferase
MQGMDAIDEECFDYCCRPIVASDMNCAATAYGGSEGRGSLMAKCQVCTRCVMDTTATEISFDEEGVCSFCRWFDDHIRPVMDYAKTDQCRAELTSIADAIRSSGSGKPYDCILGLSGGVDSSYLACIAVELGLRPLAVHVDTGWNAAAAMDNMERVIKHLGLALHVVTVDWDEMRDLQLAFYRAAVRNCEAPYDHAFSAGLYRVAESWGIPYILLGGNLATESVLPASWKHDARDLRYIKSVYARFGTQGTLRHYPTVTFWQRYFYYPIIKGIKHVGLLNYLDYNKVRATEELRQRCGWEDYGGKHHEALSTRFYQCYYLPTKFGIDKRKAHLSSLILAEQMSREDALEELTRPPCSEALIKDDKRHMAQKLGITLDEWDAILCRSPRDDSEFASSDFLYWAKARLVSLLGLRRWTMTAPWRR